MASIVICGYEWQNNNAARSESSVSLADSVCECPAGTYCPEGSAALFTPIACDTDDGNYCPKGSVSSSGEPCPAGSYCPDTAIIIPCPAGTFSNATGLASSSGCLQCEVGGYCEKGSSSTTLCPAGTFQTELGQTSVAVSFGFLHCCFVRLFCVCPFPLVKLMKMPPSSPSLRYVRRRVPTAAPAPMHRNPFLVPSARQEHTTMHLEWTHVNFALLERTTVKSVRAARHRAYHAKGTTALRDLYRRPASRALPAATALTPRPSFHASLVTFRQTRARHQAQLVCSVKQNTIAPRDLCHPSRALPAATAPTPRPS
jgi:hypothetical protein